MIDELTLKQAAFVREYLIDRNGTQAAIRAGYSQKTAEVTASRLLRNAKVKQAVAKGEEKHAERCAITVEQLTADLIKDREMARHLEQPSPAVTATMAIAKLHGLDVNRHEHAGRNGAPIENKWTVEFINATPEGEQKA